MQNYHKKPSFPQCFKELSKPHKFCPGCGHGIALKELGFAIDELNIAAKTTLGIDIGCSLLAWDFFNVNTLQTHHGRTIPVVSGYKLIRPDKVCLAYLGDGGAYAIGLQALITACARNDAITVLVINNTLYGMTGGQFAPTTLLDEVTTTTPSGRNTDERGKPFLGPELLKCLPNKKSFLARGTVSKPQELKQLIKKALEHQVNNQSFSMVEILSMCPVNWHKNAQDSLNMLENKMSKYFKNFGEIR